MVDVARQRLTVYLLQDVESFDEALDVDVRPNELELTETSNLDGRFYWQARPGRTPDWLRFLAPHSPRPQPSRPRRRQGFSC